MVKDMYTAEQVRRVLTGAGIDIEAEYGTDYIVFCPYHNNNRTPAGEVSKDHGTFFCFGCQTTKSLIEFIMHTSNRTYFEAIRYIKSKEQETSIEDSVNKALIEKPEFVQYDELLIKRLTNQALESPRAVRYFEGRSITKESINKFNLGYSEKQDSVTIPIHSPDGMCIGFVARTVEGKEFKNTPGLPKGKVLFNLHRIKASSTVYVVESSFDAIRLWQLGIPAIATLGANLGKMQIQLINKYVSRLILAMDQDDAGTTLRKNISSNVSIPTSTMEFPDGVKDIGDMTDEQILSSYKTLSEFDIALQL